MYKGEGPKDKRPAVENMLIEKPSVANLSHVSKLYKESGSENKNIEENKKGENGKNGKESSYTNINEYKKREQAKVRGSPCQNSTRALDKQVNTY